MKYNKIFQTRYASWNEIEKVIESLPTSFEKGDCFEQFVFAYLNLKKQLYQVSEVYTSKNIPQKYLDKFKIENRDSGVDGLIIRNDGKSASYQVKFRTGRSKPSYDELAKFWVEGKNTELNYTIANCYSITELSQKNEKHLQILVDQFETLNEQFFSELYELTNNSETIIKKKYEPFDFQKKMIEDVSNGFLNSDRGKLIAACGTGKTLTSLWITENLNSKIVLFLAPSLALIKQTLESWSDQSDSLFEYMCVCSDKTVNNQLEDEGDISINEMNIPVSTNPIEILKFLKNKNNNKKYIFSTYQSLPVISESLKGLNSFEFDLTIFDEAHRTSGTRESSLFSLALNNETLPSKKRLFMTATERLINPSIIKKANEESKIVFSMDDVETYGNVFHRYNFGDAIKDNVISNYQIIIAGIYQSEFYKWIKENKDLNAFDKNNEENLTSSQILFSQLILSKAIKEYPIQKTISFHSSVKNASLFTTGLSNTIPLSKVIKEINTEIDDVNLYISHINGMMTSGDRKKILDTFENTKYSVISNARCLTEGVDVPLIDSVYFVDSKNSLIDIVQACGRALRKPSNIKDKTSFFLIPILIPDGINNEEVLNLDSFMTVYNVIQSLRDQDDRLSEWINELNENAIKGKVPKYKKGRWKPISINLPNKIDLKSFEEKLYLKIADVNKNPTSVDFKSPKVYGKTERKSSQKRIFKTLGDYSVNTYFKNLVDPTIKKYDHSKKILNINEIKINHNNVSHTKKLGLIINEDKNYEITPLGEKYKKGEIKPNDLFKRQMLRYFSSLEDGNNERILFPYRSCLKILISVKSINFQEFSFAIFPLYDSSEESINNSINDIFYLREKYPNLNLSNESNRPLILSELNEYFNTNYTETDIWSKKTTINNQFIYFRDHLSLFTDFIKIENQEIKLIVNNIDKARHILSLDNRIEFVKNQRLLYLKYIQPFVNFIIFSI